MIYHMLPAVVWSQQAAAETYAADTLASEGFMHCTGQPERLIWVANRFYRQQATDFLILCIEPTRVQAEIKWEQADEHLFPHIYGPLNRDAVVNVIKFPRDATGLFLLPSELA